MSTTTLGTFLLAFFEDHLKAQKGVSTATLKSYRDALRLFLLFVATDLGRRLTRVQVADLTAERVRRFLSTLEKERHNRVSSRNQRLAALRTFFEYLGVQAPELLLEAERVMAIPVKRTPPPATHFLERDEIQTLFAQLPTSTYALRDRTLLLFLYNTGARVQEVAELCRRNLDLEHHRARLHGKGDKWRACPLWEETVSLLRQLLDDPANERLSDQPVFLSQRGQALTRFGIYKIVRRHTACLGKRGSDGELLSISPHIFRHTAAVHLLESGVEPNVIRAWLGHVSLETTNRYAEITTATKEAALRACQAPSQVGEVSPEKPIWRDDPSLLKWLQSL
jgi:site-specific recombinase XerD